VIDVGEDREGPFLVMDFVEGVPLSELLRSLAGQQQKMPLQLTLRIAIDAARGLGAAHEAIDHDGAPLHIVHRDVSPQNVLISFDGTVRITDFGIARALAGDEQSITQTGMTIGTPAYMSPEQASGDPALDARTDIYSLGCVLFELIAGEPPFTGASPQAILARVLTETARPLASVRSGVSPQLSAAVAKAITSRITSAGLPASCTRVWARIAISSPNTVATSWACPVQPRYRSSATQ